MLRYMLIGLTLGLMANGTLAAEPATGQTWTLATEDTELTLAVASNTLSIVRLRNPTQNWNWTPAPAPVPLPGAQGQKGAWTFCDASASQTNGHEVTLRFTCADPALELKSVWRALPGPGPVENEVSIENLRNIMLMPPCLLDAPAYWEAIARVLPQAEALARRKGQ